MLDQPSFTNQAAPPPKVEFLGLDFSLLSFGQALSEILQASSGPYRYVVTPNAQHIVTVHENASELLPIYRAAWLSLCDSRIVQALATIKGIRLPVVTGSDLVAALLDDQNAAHPQFGRKRILVVGPPANIERQLRRRYPRAELIVLPAPHGLASREDLRKEVTEACLVEAWDILLLCVGCPAQECIAHALVENGRASGVALCVGAAIDFVCGRLSRAPRWLQRMRGEWAYRLAAEPRRLWRRYLLEAPKIFLILLRDQPKSEE